MEVAILIYIILFFFQKLHILFVTAVVNLSLMLLLTIKSCSHLVIKYLFVPLSQSIFVDSLLVIHLIKFEFYLPRVICLTSLLISCRYKVGLYLGKKQSLYFLILFPFSIKRKSFGICN